MPDVYSMITEVEPAVVEQLATAMEVSAADPQHREMVDAYLAELDPSGDSRVVEIGCGTGAIARMISAWSGVGEVVGTDPSPILIERARSLSADVANLSFEEADGRDLPLADASFDAAVLHRVLSSCTHAGGAARRGISGPAPRRPGHRVRRGLLDDHVGYR